MGIKTLARGLTVFVALAVALTVMAVPASAAQPTGTASITEAQRTVLAGTGDAPFAITVTNALTTGQGANVAPSPNVNFVRIIPPAAFHTAISAVSAPSGWTGRVSTQGDYLFETTGSGIGPASSAVFTVSAAIGRPVLDIARRWRVYISSDNGKGSLPETTPATPGALDTSIRVLQVLTTALTSPAGVTDGSATSGQTVSAGVTVSNAGSETLRVTPEIRTSRPSGSTATASVTCPAAQDVASLASHTFTCQVQFGGAGAITLIGDASAVAADGSPPGSADGIAKNLGATVMTAAAFVYNSTSLQPTEASPGKPVTFRLTVNKTGQVLVNLNKANTTLTFGPAGGPTFTASLAEPAAVAGGTVNNLLLEFQAATVPTTMPAGKADPNGSPGFRSYDPTLTITGADENSFAVSQKPDVTDLINVDALGPIIDIITTPPPSRVEGEDAAASNGQTVSFSGTIKDRGALCATCTIKSAVIKQFNAAQGHIAGKDIPVTIANNGGNLSGSFNGSYDPLAHFMALQVVGTDGANDTTKPSNIVDVDNFIPQVTSALTGGVNTDGSRANDRTRIDVGIDERVATAAMSPGDWTVDGHRVLSAQPCPPQTSAGFDCVRLTVNPELGRNEEPNVTYAPSVPTRANDRVGLLLPNRTILAIDGILPALPVVNAIGEGPTSEKQDGQFFTNTASPGIKIEVEPGDTVTAFEDCRENPATPAADCNAASVQGELDAFDAPKCTEQADPNETVVTCTASFGTANRDVTLFFRSVDTRGNIGPASEELLTLDFVAPVLQAAQRLVDDIVVRVSEKLTDLRGQNAPRDWKVFGVDGSGFPEAYSPDGVTGSGSNERTLSGNGSWNTVTVTGIDYSDNGVPLGMDRYSDRAGNELRNQRLAVSI